MPDSFTQLVGQAEAKATMAAAVTAPVHAYMLTGPIDLTLASKVFAAGLLAGASSGDDYDTMMRRVQSGSHPDFCLISPEGATLRVDDATQVITMAATSPTEAARKVIVVPQLDQIEANAIGKLLKVIEEPPPSVVFVLLANITLPEITTIVSRCVEIRLGSYSESEIVQALVAEGVAPSDAGLVAKASQGQLDRARLLLNDEDLATRAELWQTLPSTLNGTGAQIAEQVKAIKDALENSVGPMVDLQAIELAELDERAKEFGTHGSGRATLLASHKRQLRKQTVDELRFGFTVLARSYRDTFVNSDDFNRRQHAEHSLAAVQSATEALIRNPNTDLLLQDLLIKLDN